MQAHFHELLRVWFHFVEAQGYLGVFLLMALESSIVPIPSEIIMPPAAYWAAQGRMDFWLVVLMGTAGSLFGSLVCYGVSRAVGAPVRVQLTREQEHHARRNRLRGGWARTCEVARGALSLRPIDGRPIHLHCGMPS